MWLVLLAGVANAAQAQEQDAPARTLSPGTGPKHAIAMHGEPALGPDFEHLDYANPDAPKGGKLVMGIVSTFDNLNSYIVLGNHAWPVRFFSQETLMFRTANEPFTLYGLLAETVEVPDDRSWVTFKLREEARFSDGSPVTADDVIFSAKLLGKKGRPNWRGRFERIASIDKLGPLTVRFVFAENNADRELAMLIGLMPVFSKAWYTEHEFEKTTLKPPVTSGPYVITKVDAGKSITFTRNPDYWGKDLPVNRGLYNFDEIQLEYLRDSNAAFEAFKAGEIHLRLEEDEAQWEKAYNFEAVKKGRVKRRELRHGRPSGMNALVFNTRRKKFRDRNVRRALTLLFDFEWVNRNFFYGTYERTRSYFDNSDLAAIGPATEEERELLEPYPDAVSERIMENGWVPPETGGPRAMRPNLRKALTLFRDAGYG
ncbi:MAG: extracellular solute-binding protein, partial [Alphaproteobacteria bacterium]